MTKRNFRTLVSFLLFVFFLYSLGNGSTFIQNKEQPFTFHGDFAQGDFERSQRIFSLTQASYLAYQSGQVNEEEGVDIYGFKGKSVKKAFLYSLIVPGSGEFYAGSKIKAAFFFGLDVTFWALYFNYHGKGKDKETEYQGFADNHWLEDEYIQWLYNTYGVTSDQEPYEDPETGDTVYFSHHLPDSKTDQYYEMIGKYEQFRWGWLDYDSLTNFSPTRETYLGMRRDSNNLLNKAKYTAMFSLANHILSAFDAALAVKKYNKKGEKFSQIEFKMRLVERNQELIPRLSATMRF
jgi:hypothetical protein